MLEKLELTAIEIEINFITVDIIEILRRYDFQTVYVCTLTARFRRKQPLLPLRLKYVIKKTQFPKSLHNYMDKIT